MWIYRQQTGDIYLGTKKVATGYSGMGVAKNDPLSQNQHGLGPIPQGAYLIGEEQESETHGPVAMHLTPLTGTQTYGRSGFLIHGDSVQHPGSASHGCIIVNRPIREQIAASRERLLVVIPELT